MTNGCSLFQIVETRMEFYESIKCFGSEVTNPYLRTRSLGAHWIGRQLETQI